MNNIQILMDELSKLNKEWEIQISYKYMRDIDNSLVPHLVIMFGTYSLLDNSWCTGFISKTTGEMFLEDDINQFNDDLYECFEGGYEDDLEDCLKRMIKNIKKYIGNKK